MRQVHAGQDVGGAVMSTAEPFTQVRQVRRPGKGLSQSGADTLGVEGGGELGRDLVDHLSAEALFVPRTASAAGLQVPHQAEPGEHLQDVEGRVDSHQRKPWRALALAGVVVVVPALAQGEDGEPPVVAGIVAGDVALAAVHVGQRVDAERAVLDRDRAPEEADDQAGPAAEQTAATPSSDGRQLVDGGPARPAPGYLREVARPWPGRSRRACGRRSSPDARRRSRVVARRVDVLLGVGVQVVLAVLGRPPEHALLRRALGEAGEHELAGAAGLEGAVREVAVVAGADAEHAQPVEGDAQRRRPWR